MTGRLSAWSTMVVTMGLATALLVACATGSTGSSSGPDRDEAGVETPERLTIDRLDNGVRLVVAEASNKAPRIELGLFLAYDPDLEPVGLEGASGLLLELATESAGQVRDQSPDARALALGASLEAHHDGAVLGWRVLVAPCPAVAGATCDDAARVAAAWSVLLDVALDPDLKSTTVTRRAERLRDRLAMAPDAAMQAARRWAVALAAGVGRPLGPSPTERAASQLNREELVRLHRALITPERITVIGPAMPDAIRQRLASLAAATPLTSAHCHAPVGRTFGLSAPRSRARLVARPAPGVGMPGRLELERTLVVARQRSDTAARRLELVDLGARAVLIEDAVGDGFTSWFAAASGSDAPMSVWSFNARMPRVIRLAHQVLHGPPMSGTPTLGDAITVLVGEPETFGTVPIMLPMDAPRCGP